MIRMDKSTGQKRVKFMSKCTKFFFIIIIFSAIFKMPSKLVLVGKNLLFDAFMQETKLI